ncbi:hypothetical protein PITC_032410 [Penicillium italicum]|uniref:Zn(2)-C6 fungal-type domain-containing protein n=1 Tax=Penicillium italicum TaxID=40296 RepID=A0A0A2L734_PENIT|nr:hypothetical protein PITC_032410 [Penicillium italicum]
MTSLNMVASCGEFQIPQPRKKARRSCLYCQKAHKTCGNERPCGQCVKRKVPSQCVDGHRKPPKYLNAGTKKAAKTSSHRGVTSLRKNQHQQENILNTASYDNEITEQQAIGERHMKDYRSDPFEEIFDDVIDPNFSYTERSTFRLGRQASNTSFAKGNDNFTTFFSDAEFATWSERSSSVSEESEVDTSYRDLDDGFGADMAQPQSYATKNPFSGFAISSGWSSTFFRHETEE